MRISDWSSDVCSSDLPDGVKVCFPFTTEIGMTQGFARCLCLLLGCLLAACTTRTDAQEKDMGLDPATAAYQKYGYNDRPVEARSEEHTSELQSLMGNSYAVFCLTKTNISTH